MVNTDYRPLRFGLPSKGSLGSKSQEFLSKAGLSVHKPNERQYSASIPSLPDVEVFFQRPTDIFHKVKDGTLDAGITGFDIMSEYSESPDVALHNAASFATSEGLIMALKLGFGEANLVVAVPESWLDITSIADLADMATKYREQGRKLRVASTFTSLTRTWLYRKGITNFTLVQADGALEVAPSMGYADIIADLTATGTTLKENRLKILKGGVILESEACLVVNGYELAQSPLKRDRFKHMLELVDASLHAKKYVTVVANIQGESSDHVGELIVKNTELVGLVGPSVTPVYTRHANGTRWYEINIVIKKSQLIATMQQLRKIGGKDITVSYPHYIFREYSETYSAVEKLLNQL